MKQKRNNMEHTTNIQECVDYILNNRAGWSQFTSWYMEKYNTNRQQANRLWKEAWNIISEDFNDNVKQIVNNALMELETLKEQAIADNDKRIWLEVIKYQTKIQGGEIERVEAKVTGNITLSWGNETTEKEEE